LLAVVAEGGALDRIPPTIQALLEARLDALPEGERDVLERAAVIGLEFEWEALGELDRELRRPAGTQLAALVRKELIRPHDGIEDTFQFRHILIRDAAYQSISKDLRADLHERFAGWLGGRGDEFDEIVGYHLEQAYRSLVALGPAGDRSRTLARGAAERLAASGLRANARGDALASADLLERATSLLPADDASRLSLLPSLGRALREAGQMERADSVLSEAVERGNAAGARGVVADATVSLTDLRFHRPALSGVGRKDVLRELEAAIQIFEELGEKAGLARALCFRGKVRFWAGDSSAGIEDLELAAGYARAAADQAQEADSLQYVVTVLYRGSTPVEEALERVAEIHSRAGTNRPLERAALACQGTLEAMLGRFDAARDLIGRARTLAEELGLEGPLASQVAISAGDVELLAADPARAERVLRPACETLERIGELGYLASAAPLLTDALYLQGRDDEALLLTERWSPDRLTVPEDVDAQVGWRRVRAKLLARRGDVEAAEQLSREATASAARTDFLDLRAHAVADLGEVLRLAGRWEESAAAVQEAIRLYEQKGNIAAAAALASTASTATP
jgi:tetratricopeptide (TPR) repeat protein